MADAVGELIHGGVTATVGQMTWTETGRPDGRRHSVARGRFIDARAEP